MEPFQLFLMFIYKCNSDIEDSSLISRFRSSALLELDVCCFAGEDRGDDPFFNDDPRDNRSKFGFSELLVSPERNPLIPVLLLIDDKLPDFDTATALSRTKRCCWHTVFECGG